MTKYEMKSVLQDGLAMAIENTEADLLIGVISEQGTMIVIPFWEADAENITEIDLLTKVAMLTATTADELSEGLCLGLYVKPTKAAE